MENENEIKAVLIPLMIVILIFGFCSFIAQILINKDNNDTPTLITRKATINDINIQKDESNLVSIEMIIVPKRDIEDLEITVNYFSSSNKLLKTVTENFGDVKKNGRYTKQVYITDFSVSQIFQLSYCEYKVTGGRVSYFAT